MNPLIFPYPSRRQVVYGRRGMVCTSQPLAAGAGLDILKAGGNAVDAAVATAIAMTVLEPVSNGIGSDTFALVWAGGKLHGLNGSGYAPAALSGDLLRAQGYDKMPARGWVPVNVPGTPSAWRALSRRFGRLPFEKLFESAVRYAREGYPVSPVAAVQWREQCENFSRTLKAPCHRGWFDTFAPQGRAPEPGELWRSEDMARTLEELAETGCESFYRGKLAQKIDRFSRETGGYLRSGDLAGYEAEWVQPISIHYKGCDVWEIPPNGHGLVALMALNTLRNDRFPARDDARTIHLQLEAMKLAFADGQKYITDPAYMTRTVSILRPAPPLLHYRAGAASSGRGPSLRRHRLPLHRRRGGKHGLPHPEQLHGLRLRRGHPRYRHLPQRPGCQLQSGPQPRQLPPAR